MKKKNSYSLKQQSFVAIIVSIWAFVFAFFAKPFAHGYMNTTIWLKVSLSFSIALFLSYIAISLIERKWFEYNKKWTISNEVFFYILLFTIHTLLTFSLYKSYLIKGFYNFSTFFEKISSNIILIVTPIIFITRKYILKGTKPIEKKITIKGENKLDVLQIYSEQLVCVSNAQNYVEVFYVEANILKTKLIRTSLKSLLSEFDFLIQIHRSHLLNPKHFKTWKNANTIETSYKELPVSKSFKTNIINL